MCINKNNDRMPFYEEAKNILNYNHETGIFTRAVNRSNSSSIGEIAGHFSNEGYNRISVTVKGDSRLLLAHRLAWFIHYGEIPKGVVNHINHIKSDNRIVNLESVNQSQNQWDRVVNKNNTSGYTGVTWCKVNSKWSSRIRHKGERINLGYFRCPKEAYISYLNKAKELRGDSYREPKY